MKCKNEIGQGFCTLKEYCIEKERIAGQDYVIVNEIKVYGLCKKYDRSGVITC